MGFLLHVQIQMLLLATITLILAISGLLLGLAVRRMIHQVSGLHERLLRMEIREIEHPAVRSRVEKDG